MPERQYEPSYPPVSEALAASKIGTWHWDIPDDRVTCDGMNASILGLTPREAHQGVPLQRIFDALHPDDRIHFRETTATARKHGGSVVLKVRTVPAPEDVRRVVVRGRYEADPSGRMIRGTGVLIDLTDVEGTDRDDEVALEWSTAEIPRALERLADHAIAVRRAVNDIAGLDGTQIRLLSELLLLEIGRHVVRASGSR